MRSARLVGLSQDGRFLIVATSTGEELSIAVDERFHAALRGDQPRLGQLEIEMENSLTPRDIQSRIRAGQSLDDVGRVAGLPLDRVERFAAPVLAEREHIALLAMSSSVRRRGETSGHRLLRLAVTERLVKRGVDIDSVDWDAYRREDGRWTVTASYSSGEASRQATFVFDLSARFSVADDDEARWVLGEQSPVKGPQPGRRRPSGVDSQSADTEGSSDADTEPTLDLSDQLALVRVIQPPHELRESTEETEEQAPALATVRGLHSVAHRDEADAEQEPDELGAADEEEPEGQTGSEGHAGRQEPPAVYGGLSDASAVPQTDNAGWEPAIVVDYPVEPSPEAGEGEAGEGEATEGEAGVRAAGQGGAGGGAVDGTDVPGPPERVVDGEDRAEEAEELAEEQAARSTAPRPATKRKRAAVPSWDEIMFGGPPRSR